MEFEIRWFRNTTKGWKVSLKLAAAESPYWFPGLTGQEIEWV